MATATSTGNQDLHLQNKEKPELQPQLEQQHGGPTRLDTTQTFAASAIQTPTKEDLDREYLMLAAKNEPKNKGAGKVRVPVRQWKNTLR